MMIFQRLLPWWMKIEHRLKNNTENKIRGDRCTFLFYSSPLLGTPAYSSMEATLLSNGCLSPLNWHSILDAERCRSCVRHFTSFIREDKESSKVNYDFTCGQCVQGLFKNYRTPTHVSHFWAKFRSEFQHPLVLLPFSSMKNGIEYRHCSALRSVRRTR